MVLVSAALSDFKCLEEMISQKAEIAVEAAEAFMLIREIE